MNTRGSSIASSVYVTRNGTNFSRLHSYGLDRKGFDELVRGANTVQDFAESFSAYFFALRGKQENAVLFEKSPQNIDCINDFLINFRDSHFVHLVRNPLFVFSSLLRRGFPPYIALSTWLIDMAKYYKYADNERIILVKYEKLTGDPFGQARMILKEVTGIDTDETVIRKGYENNRYRQLHSKKNTAWSISEYGKVGNANIRSFTESEIELLSTLNNICVGKRYAEKFDLSPICFTEAAEKFDYQESVSQVTKPTQSIPHKTINDSIWLLRIWMKDLLQGDCTLMDIPVYLNPISRVQKCAG